MDPELVVKFKGDLTEWSSAIAKAKADMTSLAAQASRLGAAFGNSASGSNASAIAINALTASMNSLGRQMSSVASATRANTTATQENTTALGQNRASVSNTSGELTGLLKGYLSLGAAMAAGRAFLDSTKEVQKFENQLKVASGTQEQYGKNTQFLESLAEKYNKNVLDLGANFAQLTIATKGTNLEGAKTERLFAAVTATSAALQMSVDDTNGTFRAFIQMVSKGNVQAEELRGQLGERLYGAFNLAAKSMGVTTAELNKMLERGEVLAGDLLPKLTVELENSFGADAEQNSKNLGSSIEYVTGQITLLIAEMGKSSGFTGVVSGWTSQFGEFLSKLRLVNKEYGFLTALVAGASAAGTFYLPGGSALDEYADEAKGKQPKQQTPAYAKYPLPGRQNIVTGLLGGATEIGSFPGESITPLEGESAASEKIRKAAEKAAKKAKAELDKWVSEKLAEYKDDMALALAESEANINAQYRTHNSDINTPGMAKSTGTNLNYDYGSDKFSKSFSSPVTGDGSAVNFNKTITQIQSMTSAWWEEKNAKDASAKATLELGLQMEALNADLNSIVQNSSVNLFSGIAESIGELTVSTDGIENVGAKIAGIFGDMISQVGKAIIAYGVTMKGLQSALKASFKNPYVAIAVGAIAIAAGAALKASTTKKNDGMKNNFYTGGIVKGAAGVDNIPINVSSGEMILNRGQQGTLFGILDGAFTGNRFSESTGRHNSVSSIADTGVLEAKMRADDLAILLDRGKRRLNRY